ncbi:MAG: molybdopterin converting factor subunit 1 [Betaproteobacteria bacterium]|nr:molybdopterin converting factor subunit 1 [Betaproteobacteria bacterium]NBY04159.1 molybdopterin converting factor subunit 1 [Betaproteobacteria bacterium]
MNITLRYFASVREAIGTDQEAVVTQAGDIAQLRRELMARSPQHHDALAGGKAIRVALNQLACREDAVLNDGDEVAFFPPVTGG